MNNKTEQIYKKVEKYPYNESTAGPEHQKKTSAPETPKLWFLNFQSFWGLCNFFRKKKEKQANFKFFFCNPKD